jgi:hypothetical protein
MDDPNFPGKGCGHAGLMSRYRSAAVDIRSRKSGAQVTPMLKVQQPWILL